jgi:hypothetical protein
MHVLAGGSEQRMQDPDRPPKRRGHSGKASCLVRVTKGGRPRRRPFLDLGRPTNEVSKALGDGGKILGTVDEP